MTRRSLLLAFHGLAQAQPITHAEAEERHRVYLLTRFVECFNALHQSMVRFADAYNPHKGLVWPRKEAKVLLDAMRDLEKCEAFLKER